MARIATPLKARQVETWGPGVYADGNGLYLVVVGKSRAWEFRYKPPGGGPRRAMGLGSVNKCSLAEARERVRALHEKIQAGIDPIEERKQQKGGATPQSELPTFRQCAEACIADRRSEWRSDKHAEQWKTSLETYVYPHIGDMPIKNITVKNVLDVLEPIWKTIPETASRVRNRMEIVFDFAVGRDYRSEDIMNPALWSGKLKIRLRSPQKALAAKRRMLGKDENFKSLPFSEMPKFMSWLRTQTSAAAPVLEFIILTASRLGSARRAEWNEINFEERLWTVPAHKMKSGIEHRVPLSDKAMEILMWQKASNKFGSDYVFPSPRDPRQAISDCATGQFVTRSGHDLTIHGFRATFRMWVSEETNLSREAAELSLAHAVKGVEGKYQRAELLNKRREMMQAWADYISSTGDVIPFTQQPAALAG